MLKSIHWHVWAAAAVAVAAVFVTAFDPSPLLFIAVFFALCAYIAIDMNQRRK